MNGTIPYVTTSSPPQHNIRIRAIKSVIFNWMLIGIGPNKMLKNLRAMASASKIGKETIG
jgi:hypothetical protein